MPQGSLPLEEAAQGRWPAVEAALDGLDQLSPDAWELLAEARWWSGRTEGAIAAWVEGQNAASDAGDRQTACRLCAWIAREYQALGNSAAAAGWLARAEQLTAEPWTEGWLVLARAVTAKSAEDRVSYARTAVASGRAARDLDLEVAALTRLGLGQIRDGEFGAGLACFDTAMAIATSGRTARLRTVGEACCDLVLATELTGDVARFSRWMHVVREFVDRRGYPAVMGFCATCCAEADAIQGDFGGAEQQLRAAVIGLHDSGHEARCVPPAAKLAELLVLQGRLEEAEAVLGTDEDAETLLARARLALAMGDPDVAVAQSTRVARRIAGDVFVRISACAVLAESALALADVDSATAAAERLRSLAEKTGSARARARAALTDGRVALAHRDSQTASAWFEAALDELAGVHGSVEGAEAHLELARLAVATSPDVARTEARAALTAFESVGASRGADEAAALLRGLGDRSRVGEKGAAGELTQRERQVLRLVAQGLTNAEIGRRLFISTKTAGNHVSSILTRLGLRTRAEAASYAVQHSLAD